MIFTHLQVSWYVLISGTKLTIDQIINQLEAQKASIDTAIAALKQVSNLPLTLSAASSTGSGSGRRRGRPPGSQSRGPRRTRPTYTDDFRRKVVAAIRKGQTIGGAAKQFNTSWFTVREWANSGNYEPEQSGASGATKKIGTGKKAAGQARKASSTKKQASAKRSRPAKKQTPVKALAKAAAEGGTPS